PLKRPRNRQMPLPRRLTYRFRAKAKPDLTIKQILGWCDEFKDRMKRWPTRYDGTTCLPDTTWAAIDGGLGRGPPRANRRVADAGIGGDPGRARRDVVRGGSGAQARTAGA